MNRVELFGEVEKVFRTQNGPVRIRVSTPPHPGQKYPDRNGVVCWPSDIPGLEAIQEGDKIRVIGRLQTRGRDKGGVRVYEMEVIASELKVGDAAEDDGDF